MPFISSFLVKVGHHPSGKELLEFWFQGKTSTDTVGDLKAAVATELSGSKNTSAVKSFSRFYCKEFSDDKDSREFTAADDTMTINDAKIGSPAWIFVKEGPAVAITTSPAPAARKVRAPKGKKVTTGGAKRKYTHKRKLNFSTYIRRSLKQVDKDLSLSSTSVKVVNSYIFDLFDRIVAEAASLVRSSKKRTLGSAEIQTAVRLILPAELAKHAMAEGTRALKASTK